METIVIPFTRNEWMSIKTAVEMAAKKVEATAIPRGETPGSKAEVIAGLERLSRTIGERIG